jgi:Tfp pilus assembly protein PilF
MSTIFKTAILAASVAFTGLTASTSAEAQVFYMSNNAAYKVANKAMRAGDFDKASVFFKRAINGPLRGETLLAAYNNLCAVDLARGALKDAEKACSGAIGEDRRYWRAYINRGHVRAAMGKPELAMQDLQKALSIRPNSKLVKRVLARVEQSNRLFAEAN